MNRNIFRVVFNKVRGLWMVVAEIATAAGKRRMAGSQPVAGSERGLHLARLSPLAFAAMVAAGAPFVLMSTAQAQVIADPGAPASQRPTVLTAPNGVPQVNIQTPSAAGVSRNVYTQFDVAQQGLILNNARTNAQTQLGGWI